MILVFLICLVSSLDDGAIYSADGKTLIKGNPNFKKFTVPIEVEVFQDGSENSNCFGNCQLMEQIIFPVGSKLKIIGLYSFYNALITSIDLSSCLDLVEIRDFAFYFSKLENANLPDSIEKFGTQIFSNCYSLRSFIFPKKLSGILFWDFFYCKQFTEVSFKENASITFINSEAFLAAGVTSVHIPATITSLNSPFIGCPLQEVIIDPKNKNYVFDSNVVLTNDRSKILFALNSITEYTCENVLRTISVHAFRSSQIKHIKLNQGLTKIEEYAFHDSKIESIDIPSSLTGILTNTFSKSDLQTITFQNPSNVSKLDGSSFQYCKKLQRIEIPTGVESLGESCFSDCSSLSYIWIPRTVLTLGGGSFNGVNKNCNITFEEGAPFKIEKDILYTANYQSVINYLGISGNNEVTINSKSTEILKSAFSGAKLDKINIPDQNSLSKIDICAFEGCTLQTFLIPDSVRILNQKTFKNCKFLESINLSSSLESIGDECFAGCHYLSSITFFSKLKTINNNAFDGSLLKKITFESESSLESIGDYSFKGIEATTISLPDSLKSLGYCCFENSKLETIVFKKNSLLEKISESAFCRCKSLTEIYFGENVKNFEDSSFKECISLKSMTLPETVSIVQMRAFSGCTSLSMFSIPQGNLETIYSTTFEDCVSLSSLSVYPLNLNFTAHDGCLFDYDSKKLILRLPAINDVAFSVPSTVETIGMYAFQSCVNLESITIDENCTEVGIFAFADCKNLVRLVVPSSVKKMGVCSLQGCAALGCGGIIFDPTERGIFDGTEVEEIALTPCPTLLFTALGNERMFNGLTGSLLFADAESAQQ